MRSQRGILAGFAAYLIWGLLPIFWKSLDTVPPLEILANRIIWSLAFLALYLTLTHSWGWLPMFSLWRSVSGIGNRSEPSTGTVF